MTNNFGPWATTLDSGPGARLSTFWTRRMAMLPTLQQTTARLSRRTGGALTILAAAALAMPLVYLSRTPAVRADDPAPVKTGSENTVPANKTYTSAAALFEPAPVEEFLPPLSPAERKIGKALDEPTDLSFTETPLEQVIDFLKDKHNIEIQLDTKALEDSGIGPDTPVTRKLKGISLRSALRLLLAPPELTFMIKDEVLLITTPDQASVETITRTYPVGDLIESTDGKEDYDRLVNAITGTVAPPSWDEVGGPGSIKDVPRARSLVISQTHDIHDQVLSLLRSLRAARKAAPK